MKQTILIFFSNLFLFLLQAQLSPQSNVINLFQSTPQSPVASGIQKNIDVSVGYSTGTITPSINLFTIKAGNITVPITLSYNAGNGLKVDEKSGLVGMGWSISYGGTMNYQVNGLNDFNYNQIYGSYFDRNLYSTGNPTPGNTITGFVNYMTARGANGPNTTTDILNVKKYKGRIADANIDGESDFIHYSLPAEKGGFMFYDQVYEQYKTSNLDGSQCDFGGLIGEGNITTKSGLHYKFGLIDNYLHPYKMKASNSPIFQALYGPPVPTFDPTPIDLISAKHLTEINDPQSNRNVTFEYYKFKENTVSGYDMNKTFKQEFPSAIWYEQPSQYKTRIGRYGDIVLPKKINFPNGYIVFNYSDNSALEQGIVGLDKTIKEILVYINNNLHKKIILNYELKNSTYAQDDFTSIYDIEPTYLNITENLDAYFLTSVSEENNINTNKIKYEFNYKNINNLPVRHTWAQDKYGYYNGQETNTSLIPISLSNPPFPSGANREVYPAFMDCGILTEIKNPAGAITKFEYEPNYKIIGNNVTEYLGGLRIKEILNEDPNFKLNNGLIRAENKKFTYNNPVILNRNPNYKYEYGEITAGTPYIESKMMRLNATANMPLTSFRGSTVLYNGVNEFSEVNGIKNGMINHKFENLAINETLDGGNNGIYNSKIPPNDRFNGKEIETNLYKTDLNNNLELKSKTITEFEFLKQNPEYIWNLETAWAAEWGVHKWIVWPGNDAYTFNNLTPDFNAYKITKQELNESIITNKVYENGKEFTDITKNYYDDNNSNLIKQEKLNSRGDLLITKIKYPPQFSILGNDIVSLGITGLLQANKIAMPIEKTTYIKYNNLGPEYVTSSQFYTYKDLKLFQTYQLELNEPTTNFTPAYSNANLFFRDVNYKLEMEVMKYDNFGNALELKNNKEMVTYIYGYGNMYPVAEVSNATYAQCAQILSGSPTAEINLNAYDGETLLIVLNSLRTNLPANTLVKTFAHKPMVGITIAEDANGLKQYFEYDEFNRLKIIKDKQGNILKKIDYQYQTPVIQ